MLWIPTSALYRVCSVWYTRTLAKDVLSNYSTWQIKFSSIFKLFLMLCVQNNAWFPITNRFVICIHTKQDMYNALVESFDSPTSICTNILYKIVDTNYLKETQQLSRNISVSQWKHQGSCSWTVVKICLKWFCLHYHTHCFCTHLNDILLKNALVHFLMVYKKYISCLICIISTFGD